MITTLLCIVELLPDNKCRWICLIVHLRLDRFLWRRVTAEHVSRVFKLKDQCEGCRGKNGTRYLKLCFLEHKTRYVSWLNEPFLSTEGVGALPLSLPCCTTMWQWPRTDEPNTGSRRGLHASLQPPQDLLHSMGLKGFQLIRSATALNSKTFQGIPQQWWDCHYEWSL